jgi:hypothetical protein
VYRVILIRKNFSAAAACIAASCIDRCRRLMVSPRVAHGTLRSILNEFDAPLAAGEFKYFGQTLPAQRKLR